MNVAIIGCGWVAGWHVADGFATMPERFDVVACCDTNDERLAAFSERHGILRRCLRFQDVLAMPDVDIVVVCTPPSAHHDMVIAALAAGKHVICEKPFAASLAEVDAIAAAERESCGRVMPIFQYRFGDGIARVRHVIRSGLAGRHFVSSAETAKKRGPDYYAVPWRGKFATELGGVLLTQAIHIHDLLLWLIGPVADAVCFKTTRVNAIEVEDCAVASLRLADGSLASLTATLGSARQVTRLRLCFENVTFEKECFDEDSTRPGNEPWTVIPKTMEIGAQIEHSMREVGAQKTWFARQYELFHDSIRTGEPFPVTLADARISLELITALFHSSATGGVAHLPIGPEHPLYGGWAPRGDGERSREIGRTAVQIA
ncbi:MAG: Gfo/Idh/MocA family oxidoreductase [Betaproteobacteria bacterium]